MAFAKLLSLLLAASFAAEFTGSGGRLPTVPALFAAPAAEWGAPLPNLTVSPIESALTRMAATGLQIPGLSADLPRAERLKAMAPMIQQLQGLHIDAAKFATESSQDQQVALELAIHAAKDAVSQKAYELVGEAKAMVWSKTNYNKADRDELYRLAAQLGELKRYYMDFVPQEERDFISQSELQTRAKFHDVRRALIEGSSAASADALTHGTSRAGRNELGAVAALEQYKPDHEDAQAREKLKEDLINSRFNLTKEKFKRFFNEINATLPERDRFAMVEASGHTQWRSPGLPTNKYMSLTRGSGNPSASYARSAVELVEELEELRAAQALPASAIAGSREIPPLPMPGEETKTTPAAPTPLTAAAAPLESKRPSPKKAPKTPAAPLLAKNDAAPASPAELAPASPHEPEKRADTPAPELKPASQPLVEYGFFQRIRKMLGLKD